jgi:hypothetical protein
VILSKLDGKRAAISIARYKQAVPARYTVQTVRLQCYDSCSPLSQRG